MSKPIILTLDDDPHVLRAVERDLRAQYGAEYRIARARRAWAFNRTARSRRISVVRRPRQATAAPVPVLKTRSARRGPPADRPRSPTSAR